ncbi:hypothetical protein KIPB_009509, partial [Kipferlia bialata]|eukprot:g9509.t1
MGILCAIWLCALFLLVLRLVWIRVTPSPHMVSFKSSVFAAPSYVQTHVGDTSLLLGMEAGKQTLSADLASETDVRVYLSPSFDPTIKRYAYSPYRPKDSLELKLTWKPLVTTVTVDGVPTPTSDSLLLRAQNAGSEVEIVGMTAEGERVCTYTVLVMHHLVQPMNNTVQLREAVAPGLITGMATVAGPTKHFGIGSVLRNLISSGGYLQLFRVLKSRKNNPFHDLGDPVVKEHLDPIR